MAFSWTLSSVEIEFLWIFNIASIFKDSVIIPLISPSEKEIIKALGYKLKISSIP